MARDSRLTPEVREDLLLIEKCIHLQTRLINDLLDLSRIENNKISLELKPVDVHELVHDCLRTCEDDLRHKRMAVSLNLDATHHELSGDPLRLRQILCNLIKNAAKFTPAGGSVTLSSANPTQDSIQLSVADNGIGATPEVISAIFEPFEQGGRGSESGGLGLGLTICKGLTEAHGGKIRASSEGPGSGLTVTLEFPTSSAQPVAEVIAPQAPPAGAQTPLRILLVDDHPETLRALSQLLQRLEHNVTTADCVRSALAAADVNDFDLVISDLGLPDGTGAGLMQELLKRRPLKGIALTGYGTESDIRKCLDAGFFAHLTKPIDLDQLEEVISKSVR